METFACCKEMHP